jgi:hypothetical protein
MIMGAGANAGNWLVLQPVMMNGAAGGAAASSMSLVKLEGARQGMQASALAGKNFTVVKPMMAGKTAASTLFLQPAGGGDLVAIKMANSAPALSSLVGKSVTIGQAPLVAGKTGSWLVLKPAAGMTATKALAGSAVVAKAGGTAAAKSAAITMPTATAVKTAAAGGTIWKGTGLSLGLGLGLGAWGPAILAGIGATAVYGYWKNKKELAAMSDEEIELNESLSD